MTVLTCSASLTCAGVVTLDNTDDPNLPPNAEMFTINGVYQFVSDGEDAFRSHMTMSFIFQGQSYSEDMWATLPAEVWWRNNCFNGTREIHTSTQLTPVILTNANFPMVQYNGGCF